MGYAQLIPWGISFVSMLIAVLAYMRTGKKDDKEETREEEARLHEIGQSLLKANIKLDTVCSTTTETRADIKSMTKDLAAMDRRVTIIERDMKTAFNAIEELKGKVNE